MTDGSSQGLFVVVAVVIFGIFIALSYSLFRDQLTPSLASIFSDSLNTSSKKLANTIVNIDDLKSSNVEIANVLHQSSDEIIIKHDGSDYTHGVYFHNTFFKVDTEYIFEYDIEVLEGEVATIGGHSVGFEGGNTLTGKENAYIKNTIVGNYHYGVKYSFEKGEKYNIKVALDTRNVSPNFLSSSLGLYIQPNRYYSNIISNSGYSSRESPPYTVRITNLKIYER